MRTIGIEVDLSKNWTLSEINAEVSRWYQPVLIILGVLLPFGYVANSLVIFVNAKLYRQKRSAMKILVLYLALADLVSSIFLGPLSVYTTAFPLMNNADIVCQLQRFCSDFFFLSSLFMILVIAIERYNRICRALNKQIATSTAIQLAVGITVIAAVLSIPHGIHARNTKFRIKDHIFVHVCWQEVKENLRLHHIVNFTFFCISAIIILTLYALVWLKLSKYYQKVQASHERINQEKNTPHPRKIYFSSRKSFIEINITILSIIVLFVFSYIPNLAMNMFCPLDHLKPYFSQNITRQILDINWLLSHACNPWVYGICDGRFRLECNKFFRRQDPDSSVGEDALLTSIL